MRHPNSLVYFSTTSLFLIVFYFGCSKQNYISVEVSPITAIVRVSDSNPDNKFTKALDGLNPKDGDTALLLGFDVDNSRNSEGYSQFYDTDKTDISSDSVYKTLLFTRADNSLKLSKTINHIVSPQRNGFLHLGQARYYESKPRVRNEYFEDNVKGLQGSTDEEVFRSFGFNYMRIWKTVDPNKIELAKSRARKDSKVEIDKEFRKAKSDEREWLQNITDQEKISFISDGYYTVEGFWSCVRGGASWFDGISKSKFVPISSRQLSGKLTDIYSKQQIIDSFNAEFKEVNKKGNGANVNKQGMSWREWLDSLSGPSNMRGTGYEEALKRSEGVTTPSYTLARISGRTHLLGLILLDGNIYRSFHADADMGIAPESLIKYDNPDINFEEFEKAEPETIDVFVSPNQNTVIVLTKEEIIGLDVKSKSEIYRGKHGLLFNKVVMVEWAIDDHAKRWEKEVGDFID